MSFALEKVVPWGRSFEEYVAMFALCETDLQKRILGCADGPAAFNAALTQRGGKVVSADPLYRCSTEEVRHRIDKTYADVIAQVRKNRHAFTWTTIRSVDELGRMRMAAMEAFLQDYAQDHGRQRYIDAELPHLPFADQTFDLALCSHLLFLYSEQLSEDFHVAAVQELCRVAAAVRIFPLLDLGSKPSRHLGSVGERLTAMGYRVGLERVSYEFQRGGNQMMWIRSAP